MRSAFGVCMVHRKTLDIVTPLSKGRANYSAVLKVCQGVCANYFSNNTAKGVPYKVLPFRVLGSVGGVYIKVKFYHYRTFGAMVMVF